MLEAGDFALVVWLEFDDVSLKEEVEVSIDAGDVAIELVGEGANKRGVSLTDTADELLARPREYLLGDHPVGSDDGLEHVGNEGTS